MEADEKVKMLAQEKLQISNLLSIYFKKWLPMAYVAERISSMGVVLLLFQSLEPKRLSKLRQYPRESFKKS